MQKAQLEFILRTYFYFSKMFLVSADTKQKNNTHTQLYSARNKCVPYATQSNYWERR